MAEERERRRLEGLETTAPRSHGGEAAGLDETRVSAVGRFVAPRGRRATEDLDAVAETQDARGDLGETRAPARARGDSGERRAAVRSSAGDLGGTRGPVRAAAPGIGSETGETRVRGSLQFSDVERSTPSAALAAVVESGHIGRFVVLRELGRGAMGVVFAAYDEELDRKVAIKLMHADRADDSSIGPKMLLREAQALARLAHPNVVAVHEVGMIEGAVFVAMEYVAGVDLQHWLGGARRPWREVVAVLRQAGAGLLAAHQEGLVHRDFKPSNVLVGDDGRVRVADFGLAARRGATSGASATLPAEAAMTATLTGEGALIGTPVYMAPELLVGGSATAASDQYAFCVALWEALYGSRPFEAETLTDLTAAVRTRALPAAPARTDVPPWLHAAVARGLAKVPEQRYASLAELLELLGRDPEAERQQRRRRALQIAGAIAGTAVIVALLVVAYGAVRRYAAERQAEGRLAALREQLADLRGRGEADEAGRLLQTFVALPENRGLGVISRAYLEWAAAQTDDAAAVDAYGSAYIAARTPEDGHAALHGLITRLSAQGAVTEAATALAVLARTAPDQAAAPALHEARLAAALARRDLAAAGVALAEADADGWGPVLADLSRTTDASGGAFAPGDVELASIPTLDFDGDGVVEMIHHRDGQLLVVRADRGLAVTRTIALAQPYTKLTAVESVVPGEPLWFTTHPTAEPGQAEVRLCSVDAGGAVRVLSSWPDSFVVNPVTVDLDGDGQREIYVGTEAYARKLWRLDRAADGTWTRAPAHRGTVAAGSDVMGVTAADLDGDGRPELFATVGPWTAYDVRVFRPLPERRLDQVARRSFGSFRLGMAPLRAEGGALVAFHKADTQIAPERFPPERPLGEPAGVYAVGWRGGEIEVVGHLPEPRTGSIPGRLFAADLDGDGVDELVLDGLERGLLLVRVRRGQPALRSLAIAGVRPIAVADLDGDGDAEVVAATQEEPQRVLVLGSGDERLAPLPSADIEPRALPPGLTDPVIAEAWARAEQLVAIGLPGRTARDLSAIARLAGHVAPDMLLRTAELFAAVGEDALAAEHYEAAATRDDTISAALGGAAAARRRLGEFAAAEALTRRRLAVAGPDERDAVAEELAALVAATEARPAVALTFAGQLDERWQVADPVAVRRDVAGRTLSLWASTTPVIAEYPLVWDGGPAALEVELDVDEVEWGTGLGVQVVGADGRRWLAVLVTGNGLSNAPRTEVEVEYDPDNNSTRSPVSASRVRGRVAVYPAFGVTIRELDIGESRTREVQPMRGGVTPYVPPAGPLRLQISSRMLMPDFVSHVNVRAIRLTGFTAGEAGEAGADDPARLLAAGELSAALAGLSGAPGDVRQVWKIDALLELGDVAAATAEARALIAATNADGPVYHALGQRLRRSDPLSELVARAAYGAAWIDLLLPARLSLMLRPRDVSAVLLHVPAPVGPPPEDPAALRRLVLTHVARGLALRHAGQLAAAQAAFAAGHALTDRPREAFPGHEALQLGLVRNLLEVAAALGDREATVKWVRATVESSSSPYLALERLQSFANVARVVPPEAWAALRAEIRATRERSTP